MMKAICAAAVVLAVCPAVFAAEVLIPNGSFEANGPGNGFGLAISNWTVAYTGPGGATQPNGLPTNQQSGLFSSYAKFNTPPAGGIFAQITNLGGGTTSLTSGAVGTNFLVNDRLLGFKYGFLTNDAPGAGARDSFRVHIDFFATATSAVVTGTIDQLIANSGLNVDSNAGSSPYGGGPNNPLATYNNSAGNAFNFIAIDVSAFFNSFARVSFIVDNAGPAAGTNGNGLGVTGIVLDQVILTPEPATVGLFALGALGLGGMAWRRRTAKKTLSA